jgi:hypothetical protein
MSCSRNVERSKNWSTFGPTSTEGNRGIESIQERQSRLESRVDHLDSAIEERRREGRREVLGLHDETNEIDSVEGCLSNIEKQSNKSKDKLDNCKGLTTRCNGDSVRVHCLPLTCSRGGSPRLRSWVTDCPASPSAAVFPMGIYEPGSQSAYDRHTGGSRIPPRQRPAP